MKNFSKIFNPKSIAVVGASTKKNRVGSDILKNLINDGFSGKIYPVNPKANRLMGLKCYSNLDEIKENVDLMIIAIPAEKVANILKQGAKLNIKAAIVVSAGFKEVGNVVLEEEIKDICYQKDISLIGPNCLGVINPANNLNASFASADLSVGNIALISQSGALCTAMIDLAKHYNLGFSKFISIGNKTSVEEIDLLNYLAEDKQTQIIALYTEQLNSSVDFIKVAKKLSDKNKPLIVLKGGSSEEGSGASASHTGALAGDNNAYKALFKQANVIQAEKISDIFAYLQILKNNNFENFSKLAIVSNAGGPGVLAVDGLKNSSLSLAILSSNNLKELSQELPFSASLANPIDILGDASADRYKLVFDKLINDKKVDSILVIFTPQSMSEVEKTAQAVLDLKKSNKKIAAVFMGHKLTKKSRELLRQKNIACYAYPETATNSLIAFSTWLKNRKKIKIKSETINKVNTKLVQNILENAKLQELEALSEDQAFKVLSAYNIKVVKNQLAKSAVGLNKEMKKFPSKLVLKIVSGDILHKSEVGGVKLDIDKKDLSKSYNNLIKEVKNKRPDAEISGVLLTEMIKTDNLEMIIGAVRDPLLGPMIMVGLGGIYVEVLQDKAFAVEPFSKATAYEMINSLKTVKILDGIRGKEAYDKEALADCLLKVGNLMHDFYDIKEIDINPIALFKKGKGCKALDARILINYGK